MKKKIETSQKIILNKIKRKIFLDRNNSELNIFRYLSNSNKLSYAQMQYNLNKKYIFKFLYLCIKNFFSFFYHYDYIIYKSSINTLCNNLVITWGKVNDFDREGNYFDRYYRKNSLQKKNTIWIVQYEDKFLPKKIAKNIIILKKNNFKSFHFNKVRFILKNYKLDLSILKNFSSSSLYAFIFYQKIFSEIKNLKIKKIYILFEGQIFQKHFIKKLKKKNLKIIGIVHAFLQPIAFNFFYEKNCFPDKLYVFSESLKKCLVNNFNWNNKKILVKKSTRFSRNQKLDMSQQLFFPYEIPNPKKLKKIFIKFCTIYKNKINLNFKIKIHPLKLQNREHKDLKKKICNLIKDYSYNKKLPSIAIFFEYTSSIIEALERNIKVIQLCTEPILQTYTSYFYNGIRIKQIDKNIIEYKKIKKNSLIKM